MKINFTKNVFQKLKALSNSFKIDNKEIIFTFHNKLDPLIDILSQETHPYQSILATIKFNNNEYTEYDNSFFQYTLKEIATDLDINEIKDIELKIYPSVPGYILNDILNLEEEVKYNLIIKILEEFYSELKPKVLFVNKDTGFQFLNLKEFNEVLNLSGKITEKIRIYIHKYNLIYKKKLDLEIKIKEEIGELKSSFCEKKVKELLSEAHNKPFHLPEDLIRTGDTMAEVLTKNKIK